MKIIKIFAVVLINILILSPSFSQSQQKQVDWSRPEFIDPLDWEIGDFIDIDFNHWVWKAQEAYRQKEYKQAAKYYLYLLKHNFSHEQTIYSLACCYGQLGEGQLAARYLIRAVNAGYLDIEHIKNDPDFKKVRKHPSFMVTMKNIEEYVKNFGDIVYVEAVKCFPAGCNCQKTTILKTNIRCLSGCMETADTPKNSVLCGIL